MRRIVVIGNGGGGKTTLSRKLGAALNIPVLHLDTILWKPGWERISPEEFEDLHDPWLEKESWIIDGLAYPHTISSRLQAADTIVFIDLPFVVHLWWAMKRQALNYFKPRPEFGRQGYELRGQTIRMIQILWRVNKYVIPYLKNLIEIYGKEKQVIHIRSVRQLADFEKQYCQN